MYAHLRVILERSRKPGPGRVRQKSASSLFPVMGHCDQEKDNGSQYDEYQVHLRTLSSVVAVPIPPASSVEGSEEAPGNAPATCG